MINGLYVSLINRQPAHLKMNKEFVGNAFLFLQNVCIASDADVYRLKIIMRVMPACGMWKKRRRKMKRCQTNGRET